VEKRGNRSAGKPIKPASLVAVMMQDLVDAPFTTYRGEMRRFLAAALDGGVEVPTVSWTVTR
jgi:hypothetical protein